MVVSKYTACTGMHVKKLLLPRYVAISCDSCLMFTLQASPDCDLSWKE